MRAVSTIKRLLALSLDVCHITLFGATNFYDNPSTKAEIKVDSAKVLVQICKWKY